LSTSLISLLLLLLLLQEDDYIVEYDGGFRLACDPKSLLYLFGMNLDYSDALIGGGFNFR
jgi:iron-sulfur cluster assembly protein